MFEAIIIQTTTSPDEDSLWGVQLRPLKDENDQDGVVWVVCTKDGQYQFNGGDPDEFGYAVQVVTQFLKTEFTCQVSESGLYAPYQYGDLQLILERQDSRPLQCHFILQGLDHPSRQHWDEELFEDDLKKIKDALKEQHCID